MKIKLLKGISCVLVLLFLATFASQVIYVFARGREFIYQLAQMPREQAYAVVERILKSDLRKGYVGLPMDFDQVILARLDAYLVAAEERQTIDAIYAEYKGYIPIRKEIGIPISAMTMTALIILFLKEPYSQRRKNEGKYHT